MVYYLGCECLAPVTEPWSETAPRFHVTELEPALRVVRTNLPFSCVRYLGAHTGCGCGFRRFASSMDEDDPEEAAKTQADHAALVRYLQSLPAQEHPMQIYGCWSGDEAEPPQHRRSCSVAELMSPDFFFQERELITLIP